MSEASITLAEDFFMIRFLVAALFSLSLVKSLDEDSCTPKQGQPFILQETIIARQSTHGEGVASPHQWPILAMLGCNLLCTFHCGIAVLFAPVLVGDPLHWWFIPHRAM